MVRVATWNVNSLRVRLPQVLDWLRAQAPDLVGLQETKVPDEAFPREELEALGYHAAHAGQAGYNGVALLSRTPPRQVWCDLPGEEDGGRRLVAATYGEGVRALRVVNVYVPNGERVGSDKYRLKLRWLEALEAWLRNELTRHPRLVVLGDFNVAPADEDVHDPLVRTGRIMCSGPERERFRRLLALGLCDTYRLFPQEGSPFTWWDYRMRAFQRDLGLRIDHILASAPLCERCTACRIDRGPRALPRPSDHAPVIAEFQ